MDLINFCWRSKVGCPGMEVAKWSPGPRGKEAKPGRGLREAKAF